MEIEFCGANCFKITSKKASLVIDDNLEELGLKTVTKPDDIALFTNRHDVPKAAAKLIIDKPGEYEVSNISIIGVGAQAHIEEEGLKNATMYKLVVDDVRIAAIGHIYPDLSDNQLEALGTVDVLLIPLGGGGYTLDATGALKVIKKIEPKIVVPSHYGDAKIKYPVPQQELDDAIKSLGMEPKERVSKLKLKPADLTSIEGTQLVILER